MVPTEPPGREGAGKARHFKGRPFYRIIDQFIDQTGVETESVFGGQVRGRDAEWPSRAACIGGREGRQAPRLAMAAATQRLQGHVGTTNDVPSTSFSAAVEAVLLPAMLCRCIARCPAVQGRPWRPQVEARAQGPAVHGAWCCFLTICCFRTLFLRGSSHCAVCSASNLHSSSFRRGPLRPYSCLQRFVLITSRPRPQPSSPRSMLPSVIFASCILQANMGHDTNTAHFSIMMGPAPHLDGDYTIFGVCTHCLGCECMHGVQSARWQCV